jgi:hypothetical protein
MTTLIIEDEITAKLSEIAADENRPVTAVLESLLELYSSLPKLPQNSIGLMTADEALAAMEGMVDDDITDLSTTVRETMAAYYKKKYGDSD